MDADTRLKTEEKIIFSIESQYTINRHNKKLFSDLMSQKAIKASPSAAGHFCSKILFRRTSIPAEFFCFMGLGCQKTH